MPIKHGVRIKAVSEDEFHSLDYRIMEAVFSIHKDLGRFYDERIYQNELAYRCREMGFKTVATEVPIEVLYRNFRKIYYIDLLIDNRVIYELKTAEAITDVHRKQALNYLLLMGMHHGKLVNMRPQSVQYSFVSTRLTPDKRYQFMIDDRKWEDVDEDSFWLKQLMKKLLSEWGVFLDTNLFRDAVIHFRGGEQGVITRVEVVKDSRVLGTQRMDLLNKEVAFKMSSVTKGVAFYEKHLRQFISHTSLKAIQWVNFNHAKILFKTLCK